MLHYCRKGPLATMTVIFAIAGPTLWNSLPLSVHDPSLTLTQLCARLKTVLFCRAYETLA